MHNFRIAAAVAASIGMLGLAACGDRQNMESTAQNTPPVTEAPMPAEPAPVAPPSAATEHEQALTGMGAQITDEGLKVTLASADFPSGSAAFEPENTDRIDHVAALLKERDDLKLRIIGYTDDRGSDSANQQLSQRRAEAVEERLVSQAGIPEDRVEAVGMGEADPVASNDSEEGRAQNRRVELVLVGADGKYQSLDSNDSATNTTASTRAGADSASPSLASNAAR